MAITLISTITVGAGGASSIDFQNIPATGKDLLVQISLDTNGGFYYDQASMRINNDANGNYLERALSQQSQSIVNTTQNAGTGSFTNVVWVSGTNNPSGVFGVTTFYLADYLNSTPKPSLSESAIFSNETSTFNNIHAGEYNNTNAITRLEIFGRTFLQHCKVSLYIIS